MKYETKKLVKRSFVIYALVNVFTYLFAHVAYLFANDASGEIFEYVSYYLSKSVEFLAPPVLAAIAYLVLRVYDKKDAMIFTLTIASARIFYSLPYYYIIFIYNYGYDSVEAILLSLLAAILVILVTVLGVYISIGAYVIFAKRVSRRDGTDPEKALDAIRDKARITDFLEKANLPILVFALMRFVFSLSLELYDTVTFFIEYGRDYRPSEIVTILANYTLLFVLLVAAYLSASAIKGALISASGEDKPE